MLAELGYAALALDLYGAGQVASSPDEAGAFMGALTADMSITQARFSAALNAFGALEQVDERQLAAIGYCFGGGVVLHMARKGLPLQAAASFHGSVGLAACDGVSPVPTRLVAYHGDEDQLIAAEDMAAYLRTMDDAGANHQLVQLPGALHGFSNPAATAKGQEYGLPLAYDELADRCSWAHVQMLLRETFKDSGDSA
jgi:dienelactone hydrolase